MSAPAMWATAMTAMRATARDRPNTLGAGVAVKRIQENMDNNNNLMIPAALVDKLVAAQHITVLTGAGVSAESGVPTFRDAQTGLWAQYSPTELASPEAFARNPQLVWNWYAMRRRLVEQVEPNAGHRALVELAAIAPQFTLITQNVDGLHQRAGSVNVIELHGGLFRYRCYECDMPVTAQEWQTGAIPPKCPTCGGNVRPDIVWFGESLPERNLALAFQASRVCDVFLSIGTSGVVAPASSLPYEALSNHATVVEINPKETELTYDATFVLRGPAGQILPALVAKMKQR